MENAPSGKSASVKSEWVEKFKLAATIITIVAAIAAIATFIGLKPEKSKVLEWKYFTKNTLVNRSAIGEKIEITYNGRKISQLTAISARLLNSGSIPIDGSSDVKDSAFPKLVFQSNLLGVEIKSRSQDDIKASVIADTNSLKIEHGLLNPGDWLNFQIFLEGDPGEITNLPKISYRISGITEPKTSYPTVENQQTGVAYFRFSKPTNFVLIIIASLTPIVLLFFVIAGTHSGIQEAFPEKNLTQQIQAIHKLVDATATGAGLQNSTASAYWTKLKGPYDQRARQLIRTLPPIGNESFTEYQDRVKKEIEKQIFPRGFTQRIKAVSGTTVFLVLTFGLLAVGNTFIMLGSWHYLITTPH